MGAAEKKLMNHDGYPSDKNECELKGGEDLFFKKPFLTFIIRAPFTRPGAVFLQVHFIWQALKSISWYGLNREPSLAAQSLDLQINISMKGRQTILLMYPSMKQHGMEPRKLHDVLYLSFSDLAATEKWSKPLHNGNC